MPQASDDITRPAVKAFADELGLEPSLLASFGIGQRDRNGNVVGVPCRDHHGDLVSMQDRTLDDGKKQWPEGGRQWTFGAEDIDPLKPLILVEGAVDWILCRSMHMNVVGLPSATFKAENAEWLDQFHESDEVIVLDEGGRAAAKMFKTLAGTELADRITVFTLDHKDIYDIWKREGRDPVEAKAVIEAAIAERIPFTDYLSPSGWEELHSTERIRSFEWGGYVWTLQYTHSERGGKVELRINDGDGILRYPDSIAPTYTGVAKAAKTLDSTRWLVSNGCCVRVIAVVETL